MLQEDVDNTKESIDTIQVNEGIDSQATPIQDVSGSNDRLNSEFVMETDGLDLVDDSRAKAINDEQAISNERAQVSSNEGNDDSFKLMVIIAIISIVIIVIICFILLMKNLGCRNRSGDSLKKSKQEKGLEEQQGQMVQVFTLKQIQKMHEIRRELEMRAQISQGQSLRQIEQQIE